MRVTVAGAHGQVALLLNRRLTDAGHDVVGLVRNPAHIDEVGASGARGVVCDLESASLEDVEAVIDGSDAVVFAAGSGPGSGTARKDTMDRAGAELLARAAGRAGASRYVLVSSMGVETVRDSAVPSDGVEDAFTSYLRAKLASEDAVRATDLAWTVLRPGRLTDGPGTGQVHLADRVDDGAVPREDVAAVLVALLEEPRTSGKVLELVAGPTPVDAAVAAAARD